MLIAVDTETTGVTRACRPFIVSACSEAGKTYLWQWRVNVDTRMPIIPANDKAEIRELLWSNHILFHNTKFDVRMLSLAGIIDGRGFMQRGKYDDTLIASHCLNSLESHGLKPLAEKYLEFPDDDETELQRAVVAARRVAKKEGWRYAQKGDPHWPSLRTAQWPKMDYWLPREVALRLEERECSLASAYAIADVERTLGLWLFFRDGLHEEKLWDQYLQRRALLDITYRMEECGVPIHMTRTKRLVQSLTHDATKCEETCAEIEPINPRSHGELRGLLFGKFNLPKLGRTPGGQPSLTAPILLELLELSESKGNLQAHSYIKHLLFSRKLSKAAEYLEQYYLHATKRDDLDCYRLHGNLNITGTHTTRFSASFPNTQNISKGENPLAEYGLDVHLSLRQVFGPAEGRRWYAIDYKQLQIAIFAYASGEDELRDALLAGFDAHSYTAQKIFDKPIEEINKFERRVAKNVNFGFIFGASPAKIEQTAGIAGLWSTVIEIFPHAHEWIMEISDHVMRERYVETLDGYKILVPHDKPYAGVNYIVQGSEGRLVQRAMQLCDEFLQGTECQLIMNIHDELVFDCPDNEDSDAVARQLALLMIAAGQEVGMELGVDIECCEDSLDQGQKLSLFPEQELADAIN